jgi:hypothetical protein
MRSLEYEVIIQPQDSPVGDGSFVRNENQEFSCRVQFRLPKPNTDNLTQFLQSVSQLLVIANVFPISLILSPLCWTGHIPPKHRSLQEPHDITSLKKAFFILAAGKNLKFCIRGLPRTVKAIALFCYIYVMFVPHRKYA